MKIKGKTIIELTDAKTGKLVQRTEDNNMLTNALSMFFAQGGRTNPTAFNVAGVRNDALTYLLGGIMLFDTAITEDADIVRVPKGVRMVANGAKGITNSEAPTEFGSYNSVESGYQQDGSYKMVWDWNTSQGNGNINCVCLSSYYGGYCGIGNASGAGKSGNEPIANYNSVYGSSVPNFYLGQKNNKVYSLEAVRNVEAWTVKEYAYSFSEVDIRDNYSLRETDSFTVTIPNELKNIDTKYYMGGYKPYTILSCYQVGDIMSLLICPVDDGSAFLTAYVVKYNVATKQIVSCITVAPDSDMQERSYGRNVGLSDKWLVWEGIGLDLTNTVNKVTLGGSVGQSGMSYPASSDIFYGASQLIDMDLEEINPINSNGNLALFGAVQNDLLRFSGSAIYRDPRYIATINNLEAQVTKDASKTMKVTYVLRFS